jgi:hypothetical protein
MSKESGDPKVVIAAALLHDIGIPNAERKYNSSCGRYQELEGPPVARKILEDLGIGHNISEHVCRIIANHHSGKNIDTPEFRIIWDADFLVNIPEEFDISDKAKISDLVGKVFRTETGRKLAKENFLN